MPAQENIFLSLSTCLHLQYRISFGNKKPDNVDWVYIIKFYEEGTIQCTVGREGGSRGIRKFYHFFSSFGHSGPSGVSENSPNEFPMPQNLGIDTKIKSLAYSEPKL